MHYSDQSPLKPEIVPTTFTNEEFFRRVAEASTPDERRGAILLLGGRDPRSVAVRHAQAALRMDRRPSYWSHAALIADWSQDGPSSAVGLECTLAPREPAKQTPERNGVTSFSLGDYAGGEQWANVAMCLFELPRRRGEDDPRIRVVEAAAHPMRAQLRYPLWDWLALWVGYTYAPHTRPNPLLEAQPHPGAALCEYAYGEVDVDLTPGATAPNACPELLWASMIHWYGRLTEGSVRVFRLVRDPDAVPLPPLDYDLAGELPPGWTSRGGEKATRQTQRANKTKTKASATKAKKSAKKRKTKKKR